MAREVEPERTWIAPGEQHRCHTESDARSHVPAGAGTNGDRPQSLPTATRIEGAFGEQGRGGNGLLAGMVLRYPLVNLSSDSRAMHLHHLGEKSPPGSGRLLRGRRG